MAKTYIYNCSSRPEVNELINTICAKFSSDSFLICLRASCPTFILNHDWTKEIDNDFWFHFNQGLLAKIPQEAFEIANETLTNFPISLGLQAINFVTSETEDLPEEIKAMIPTQVVYGHCEIGQIIIDLQEKEIFFIWYKNFTSSAIPGGLIPIGDSGETPYTPIAV